MSSSPKLKMDLSQGLDAKRWGCSLFIVSILVWLITITAVFQIRIYETSEETLPGALTKLKVKISDETLPDALAALEAEISDKTLPNALAVLKAKISNETIPEALAALEATISKETLEALAKLEDKISDETLPEKLAELENKISDKTLPEALTELETKILNKTLPEILAELEAKISNETLPEALAELEAKINASVTAAGFLIDLCSGVTCEGGFTARKNNGICECSCETSSDKAIAYAPFAANVCDNGTSPPSVKCGGNEACGDDPRAPFCLYSTGVASGYGVIPSPGITVPGVTCQCNANHHCKWSPNGDAKKPFCGTGESADPGNGNRVAVGQCGKCQVLAAGGGGISVITQSVANGLGDGSAAPTSCGNGNVCCDTGECASSNTQCTSL